MTVDDNQAGTKSGPCPVTAELGARRAAAVVLGDYKAELGSAPLGSPPGREWMLRLSSVLEDLLEALDDPAGADADAEVDDDDFGCCLESFCSECGSWVSVFAGRQGWHHYRSSGTVASPVEIHDAGHEAKVAWCEPPGREFSPADIGVIRKALADAVTYRSARAAGCPDCAAAPGGCADHRDNASRAAAYEQLLRRLVTGGAR